ncbi:MAG: hypothetical protein PHE17_06295 [Thiothrix sp.]|uniref:hypothetical protein n=1 Tax=Thiothrix sp. TaxID=1032 RepID=UPI002634BEE1|nr:hypothetical protein [Thiothrix sp.]MDD5392612.1 hypothetical protein [Thiothrix sp.]
MKTFYYTLTIALLGSTGTTHAADTVTQNIDLTIPLVELIDVENISPTFDFSAPSNAGDGFAAPEGVTSSVAITSNNPNAQLDVHTSSNINGIDLKISSTSGICDSSTLSDRLSTAPQYCSVGKRQTSSGSLTISAEPSGGNGMIPYGTYSTDIIYTLTQN